MHIWKLSDMHFSNYVSLEKATQLVSKGTKKITLTRTAFRQTPAKTLKFLKENGVEINIVERRGRPRKLSKQEIVKILIARKEGLSFYKDDKRNKMNEDPRMIELWKFWARFQVEDIAPNVNNPSPGGWTGSSFESDRVAMVQLGYWLVQTSRRTKAIMKNTVGHPHLF